MATPTIPKFNQLQKPPPKEDARGWERWYYRVCELLNNSVVGGWVPEAPVDGSEYVRKNAGWTAIIVPGPPDPPPSPSNTVSAETTSDIAPTAGSDLTYARGDHTHGTMSILNVIYADNAAALAGGLQPGEFYRLSDGTVMVTYFVVGDQTWLYADGNAMIYADAQEISYAP